MIEIDCPQCGIKNKVETWKTINAQISPEAKEKLLKGKINLLHCKKCGLRLSLPIVLLYHDMELRFCVYYIPFSSVENGKVLDQLDDSGEISIDLPVPKEVVPDYFKSPHVVFNMGEMARYVIFRDMLEKRKASTRQQERR